MGVHLISKVQNTLFINIDATYVTNKWEVERKTINKFDFFYLLHSNNFQGDFLNKLCI